MMKAARDRPGARHPLLRDLLRIPMGRRRIRAQRVRARRRRLDRVRSGHPDKGHLQAARPPRRGRPRRNDAARELRLRSHARARSRTACTAPARSTSVTGTGTSSIACTSETLVEHGFRISGRSPDGKFVEIAELPGHPWFLAVQFHPEFKSKPTRPHPLFASFVEAGVPAQDRRTTIAKPPSRSHRGK